jgi:DNA ligase-1
MSRDTVDPELCFYVFDHFLTPSISYSLRLATVERLVRTMRHSRVEAVEQTRIRSPKEAYAMEERVVRQGFEGLILRQPDGTYKHGRSTLDEQLLLKWKRFEDGECQIIGIEEGDENQNEAELDERGYTKRSKKKAGMKPNGMLGRFVCRDRKLFPNLEEFRVGGGPGLTIERRKEFWRRRKELIGKWMKYRFQRVGTKDAPRFPKFIAIRNWRDM